MEVILIIGRQINIPIHVRVIIHGECNTQVNVLRKAILSHKISNPHVYVV
jgi:autonomous glycyl radical cofactor GrcA